MAIPSISPDSLTNHESQILHIVPALAGSEAESWDDLTAETEAQNDLAAGPLQLLQSKPAQTIFFILLLAVVLPVVLPGLAQYREAWPDLRLFTRFNGSAAARLDDVPGGAPGSTNAAAPVLPTVATGSAALSDPQGAMNAFYQSLAKTAARQPHAITRIIHYGDSPISADFITGTTRRKMQEHFGDAGHGFILASRPWAWYNHEGFTFTGSGWASSPLLGSRLSDGAYGLGGVSARAAGAGHYARYAPAATTTTGQNSSRIEVYYYKQPNGGSFSVASEDGAQQNFDTNDANTGAGFAELRTNATGTHSFEIKVTGGNVRLFGAVLENDGPGVVYDSIGITGAYAGLFAKEMNEQHWAEELRHRNPNLVIINYGTNESQFDAPENFPVYEKDLREVVRRVRAALPQSSLLIMAPMDRGKRGPGGNIITLPAIPKIVEMQRRVAEETGCAFFDTFAAMGGNGTMAQWYAGVNGTRLVGGDLMHPTVAGAEYVGQLLYNALAQGYENYQTARAQPQATPQTKKN